jgi:hypothetical protein
MANDSQENKGECLKCHGTMVDFDSFQIFNNDYSGDGVVKGAALELEDLKATLLAAIEARGLTNQDAYPYWSPATGGPWDGPDGAKLKKAAYNYLFVDHDPGAFVHDVKYAVQLLRDSYQDLTGTPLGGVRP